MKLFVASLAIAGTLSLCACAAAPLPTAPSLAADGLVAAGGFDPDFFRAFVRNGFESPERLEPVRRLPGPIRIYLRTHDDTGRPIDAMTLDTTERVLVESARTWSGDQLGATEVMRGTGTREKLNGWLTVKWATVAAAGGCGRSTVGIDGGFMEFNDLGACGCGTSSRVYPRVVRHELGHAMGYYHTDHPDDVMYGRAIAAEACDVQPSARERLHARYAYGTFR